MNVSLLYLPHSEPRLHAAAQVQRIHLPMFSNQARISAVSKVRSSDAAGGLLGNLGEDCEVCSEDGPGGCEDSCISPTDKDRRHARRSSQ